MVLIVLDAGYDIVRSTWLLADLPVHLLGRIRCDRVMHAPAPPARRDDKPGRPPRHGDRFAFAEPATWNTADQELTATHTRYGTLLARAFDRLHPAWNAAASGRTTPVNCRSWKAPSFTSASSDSPGDRTPKPLWLWSSRPARSTEHLDRLWRNYLRRFDLEHTFRFWKQTLGLTRPRLRTPEQADRWAWLIVVAYTQLRLARDLTDDLRQPWEPPLPADKLTPGRVRQFRRIRRAAGIPASAPKTSRPGPGRPKGRTSTPAPRHPVGKNRQKTSGDTHTRQHQG